KPATSFSIACGWSPAGEYGATSSKRSSWRVLAGAVSGAGIGPSSVSAAGFRTLLAAFRTSAAELRRWEPPGRHANVELPVAETIHAPVDRVHPDRSADRDAAGGPAAG